MTFYEFTEWLDKIYGIANNVELVLVSRHHQNQNEASVYKFVNRENAILNSRHKILCGMDHLESAYSRICITGTTSWNQVGSTHRTVTHWHTVQVWPKFL